MPTPPYRRTPGVPARLLSDVERMSQQSGSGDLGVSQDPGGTTFLDQSRPPIWAVIDAQPNPALNAYGFTRVDDGTGDGTFPDLPGTTETSDGDATGGDLVAWEVNGRTDVATDGTVKVLLTPNRLGRGYTFTAPSSTSPPPPPPPPPIGCGWVAGLLDANCLTLTVEEATGRCSAIDTSQVMLLVYDTGTWTSVGTDEPDFTYDTGAGPVVFEITADGLPKLTIDGNVGVLDLCRVDDDGYYHIDFVFGGTVLCDGTNGLCGTNSFKVRLTCRRCAIRVGYNPGNISYNANTSQPQDNLGWFYNNGFMANNNPFGPLNGYTGVRGTPFIPLTTAELDKCDVFVYHVYCPWNWDAPAGTDASKSRYWQWTATGTTAPLTGNRCSIVNTDLKNWILAGGRCLIVPHFVFPSVSTGGSTYINGVLFSNDWLRCMYAFSYEMNTLGSTIGAMWTSPWFTTGSSFGCSKSWNKLLFTSPCGFEAVPTACPIANGAGNLYASSQDSSGSGSTWDVFFQGGTSVASAATQYYDCASGMLPTTISLLAAEQLGAGYVMVVNYRTFFVNTNGTPPQCQEFFTYARNFRDLANPL